jgi:thiol-disulfide isomerase/thioredoxin
MAEPPRLLCRVKFLQKADKQDGGHCGACQKKIIELGEKTGDYKSAEAAAQEMIDQAQGPAAIAEAHLERGALLLREALIKNKEEIFADADKEFRSAETSDPNHAQAYYGDGLALAHLKRDEEAKAQFRQFIALKKTGVDSARAARYAERPELARARMAPPFATTAADGRRVSLDDFTGKVVLIDFWATWCGPCRQALPHIQKIAQKFSGEPLVIISVSLDSDEQKWRSFIAQNNMTWVQVRDGGFTGPLSRLFGVNAIPHTFTIDTDGVLQDEHIGDGSIEGKLKKLCAQAHEMQESPKQAIAVAQ